MTIEIIYGPERSGKKAALLKKAAEVIETGKSDKLTIIVPTVEMARQLPGHLLSETSLRAFALLPILTYEAFAEKIVKERRTGFRKINRLTSAYLLREIIQKNLSENRFDAFRTTAPKKGFTGYVSSFISTLKLAEIEPEELKEKLKEKGIHSGLNELVFLYKEYQDYLNQNNLYDNEGIFWNAVQSLKEGTPEFIRNLEILMFYGFTSFTYVQKDLLTELSEIVPEVKIFLCFEEDDERKTLFDETRHIIRLLEPLGPKITRDRKLDNDWHLRGLERNLFRADEASVNEKLISVECSDRIRLFKAPDISTEVEVIASEIKRLLISGKYNAGDIAVIIAALPEYERYIDKHFIAAGIPYLLMSEREMPASPLKAGIKKFISAAFNDMPRKDFKQIAAGSFFYNLALKTASISAANDNATEGLIQEDIIQTALDILEKSIVTRGLKEWEKYLSMETSETVPAIQKIAVESLKIVVSFAQRLRSAASLSYAGEVLLEFLKAGSYPFDLLIADNNKQFSNNYLELESLRSLFESQFQSLVEFAPRTSTGNLRDKILFLVSKISTPNKEPLEGRVLITNPYYFRGRRTAVLFFAGLNTGKFPIYKKSTVVPFEEQLCALNAGYALKLPRRLPLAEDQMILFYTTLCSADKNIMLSWVQDDQNKPSVFINDVIQAIPGIKATRELPSYLTNDIKRITDTSMLFRNIQLSRIRSSVHSKSIGDYAGDYKNSIKGDFVTLPAAFIKENILRLENLSDIENGRQSPNMPDVYDGRLRSPAALKLLGKKYSSSLQFTVSMLQTFGECPFRFFAENTLGLKTTDEKSEEPDRLREGIFYHAVLKNFYSSIVDCAPFGDNYDLLMDFYLQNRNELETVMEQEFNSLEKDGFILRSDYWVPIKEKFREHLRRFVEFDLKETIPFTPLKFELGFGTVKIREDIDPISSDTPVIIKDGPNEVCFQGIIDRIDINRNPDEPELRVIDYKSSFRPGKEEIINGTDFQLFIYILAARNLINSLGLEASNIIAQYLSIKKLEGGHPIEYKGAKTEYIDRNDALDVDDILKKYIFAYIDHIRSGFFPPYPKKDECKFCGLRRLCRFDETRINLKKAGA